MNKAARRKFYAQVTKGDMDAVGEANVTLNLGMVPLEVAQHALILCHKNYYKGSKAISMRFRLKLVRVILHGITTSTLADGVNFLVMMHKTIKVPSGKGKQPLIVRGDLQKIYRHLLGIAKSEKDYFMIADMFVRFYLDNSAAPRVNFLKIISPYCPPEIFTKVFDRLFP